MASSKRAMTRAGPFHETRADPSSSRRALRRRVFALVLVTIMVVSTLGALVYAIVGGL